MENSCALEKCCWVRREDSVCVLECIHGRLWVAVGAATVTDNVMCFASVTASCISTEERKQRQDGNGQLCYVTSDYGMCNK